MAFLILTSCSLSNADDGVTEELFSVGTTEWFSSDPFSSGLGCLFRRFFFLKSNDKYTTLMTKY
jgi:hypothetical protein